MKYPDTFRVAPGTKVKLLVRSDDAEGEVVLTLRDLV